MVKVISDSTCDLSPELLKRYDVDILPLHILLGDKDYLDVKEISPDEIYAWSDANKLTPKTAACSLETVIEVFRNYLEQGMDIVAFSISDEMSSSGSVMRMAVDELNAAGRIHVVNSANLSTGLGLLVVEAAEMAQQGRSAAEIVNAVEQLRPRVRASFVVDTLTYLHRGGRCGGVAALLGSTLKLHPKIVVSSGKMAPAHKYRGKMARVIEHYAADLKDELLTARPERVFITHSGCAQQDIDATIEYLRGLNRFDEVLVTRAGGVISSHCGPGTLGVLFIAGE